MDVKHMVMSKKKNKYKGKKKKINKKARSAAEHVTSYVGIV